MTSKEKVLRAIAHKPGPIPVDLGGASCTGIHASVVEGLREYYGLPKRAVKISEVGQMLGEVDDDLRQILGIDTVQMTPYASLFGYPFDDYKEWKTPWGQVVLVPGQFKITHENGRTYQYPRGDDSCMPCAVMPDSSYFFDYVNRQKELPDDEEEMDFNDNLEEFGPVSDEALAHYRSEAKRLCDSPYAVVAAFGYTTLAAGSQLPGLGLKDPKGIRCLEEWYMSTLIRPGYIKKVFARQAEIAKENLAKIYQAVGEAVDVDVACVADFGTQRSRIYTKETFASLYAPAYSEMNRWVHENTGWKIFKHSCGSIEDMLGEFIDVGFDIINPVQWTAGGTSPKRLKDLFGDRVTFWGGGVDTQGTLPFGTPEQVRGQVLEICEVLGRDGGFVFNTVHNIQAKTPVENVVAMYDAVKEFNGTK